MNKDSRLLCEAYKDILDKKTFTPEQIAQKHGVSVEQINTQLQMGIKVEHEHTSDTKTAREIALDHLNEVPDYYTKLKKVENPSMQEDFANSNTGAIIHQKTGRIREQASEILRKLPTIRNSAQMERIGEHIQSASIDLFKALSLMES